MIPFSFLLLLAVQDLFPIIRPCIIHRLSPVMLIPWTARLEACCGLMIRMSLWIDDMALSRMPSFLICKDIDNSRPPFVWLVLCAHLLRIFTESPSLMMVFIVCVTRQSELCYRYTALSPGSLLIWPTLRYPPTSWFLHIWSFTVLVVLRLSHIPC